MKFIAIYEENCGVADTLEEAYDRLTDAIGDIDRDDVVFYEATKIDVEFKIVRKETPVKAATKLVGSK